MTRRREVLFMGVPFEVRLSKGAVHILREAEEVHIDPTPVLSRALLAVVEAHRGHISSPPKIGTFGVSRTEFTGLKGSIQKKRAKMARDSLSGTD